MRSMAQCNIVYNVRFFPIILFLLVPISTCLSIFNSNIFCEAQWYACNVSILYRKPCTTNKTRSTLYTVLRNNIIMTVDCYQHANSVALSAKICSFGRTSSLFLLIPVANCHQQGSYDRCQQEYQFDQQVPLNNYSTLCIYIILQTESLY